MPDFSLRPQEKSADKSTLDGAFRVHLSAKSLEELGLRSGDPCSLDQSDGSQGIGFAWPAPGTNTNRAHVKVTELFKETFGLSFQRPVNVKKCQDTRAHADAVYVESSDALNRGALREDFATTEHAVFRIQASLDSLSSICAQGPFDVYSKLKERKRRFKITKIEPAAEPGVLYVSDHQTRVVVIGEENVDTPKTIQPAQSLLPPVETVDFERIGGLQNQLKVLKESIQRMIRSSKFPKSRIYPPGFRRGGGILLYGPEGTGKSLVIQSLAKAFQPNVFEVSSETLGSTAKEARTKLKEIFSQAEKAQPSLITVDHFENVFGDQESARKDLLESLTLRLRELQGSQTLVVAAARSLQTVDKSLRSYDTFNKVIEIPIPDAQARTAILKTFLSTSKQDELCTRIGERTHGFVGRDLVELCIVAIDNAEKRLDQIPSDNVLELPNGTDPAEPPTETTIQDHSDDTIIANHLTDTDFTTALHTVRPSAMKEVFLEPPRIHWTDIGGAHAIQTAMYALTIRPYKHPELITRLNITPQKGILLYGPPGCSKTLTAQAIATESGRNFLAVKGAELLNMYVGESERAVRELFRKARAASPSIIFFDEIDAIAGSSRGGGGGSNGLNVVTTLLNEMDGIETLSNVLVVAATNAPEVLDPALMRPGRIDTILYVGPPAREARKEIFGIRNRKRPVAPEVDFEGLAERTEGHSGAEIARICDVAVEEAATEWEAGDGKEDPVVAQRHFEAALLKVPKQITEAMRFRYERWQPGGVSKLL